MRGRTRCFALWCLAAMAAVAPGRVVADGMQPFDPAHSRITFELRTRWGQRLQGAFPDYDGAVILRPDRRRQVRLQLRSGSVEIDGHPRYTQWARGPNFFDAARHPVIEFVSEPYDEALLRDGGVLAGTLRMLGSEGNARFELAPADCAQPGRDCDVVARGSVDRTDYGMSDWRIAVHDEVRFVLRVRTLPMAEPAP